MKEILKQYVNIPSVAGREEGMENALRSKLGHIFEDVRTDNIGNLIMHKSGAGKKLLLCAPIDDFGIIVTYSGNGKTVLGALGNTSESTFSSRRVGFFDGTGGVLMNGGKDESDISKYEVFFGGDASQDGNPTLPKQSERGYFYPEFNELGAEYVTGRGIKSKLGAALVTALILDEYKNGGLFADCDVTLIFYVQSKLDTKGITAASFGISADIAVIFDYTDVQNTDFIKGGLSLLLTSKRYVCPPEISSKLQNLISGKSIQVYTDNESVICPEAALYCHASGFAVCKLCFAVKDETVRIGGAVQSAKDVLHALISE